MEAMALVAGVVAFVDWWAVVRHRRSVERWAKPAVMVALAGVVLLAEAPGDVRSWVLVAVLFGMIGDVALLDGGDTRFLIGLGSFALGHAAYVVAALIIGFDIPQAIPGLVVIAALLGFRFATRVVPGAADQGGSFMAGAVWFYAVVIGAMVTTAWGTGSLLAGLGASLFAASDWLIGHDRFVGPAPGGSLAVMVLYHLGQFALIAGLVGT